MPKALLFDFDGVLVDSMPYWGGTMLRFLEENRLDYPADIIRRITPLGNGGAVNYFREHLGLTATADEGVARVLEMMLPDYRDRIPLKDGVRDYLLAAKEAGYRLNVLTASPHTTVEPCLERNGVRHLFENIWSCEDFATTKSDPAIYTAAAARLGLSVEDCLFFDDNIIAAQTAHSAGMPTVGIYDASGESFANEMKATLPRYVHSFAELMSDL